jgi:hypothetical protein
MNRPDSDPGKNKVTRRRFTGLALAATATVVLSHELSAVASAQSLFPQPPEFTGPWASIHASAARLEAAEVERNKPAVGNIRRLLRTVEPVYEQAHDRAATTVALVERQQGASTLTGETEKVLGKMMHLKPRDVIPFYADVARLEDGKAGIGEELEGARRLIGSTSASERADYYSDLQQSLDSGRDYLDQATGTEAKEICRSREQRVLMDPNIIPSPEGRAEYERDTAILRRELATMDAFKGVCAAFVIYSPRYGELKEPTIFEIINGLYRSDKPKNSRVYSGVHLLSRDTISPKGKFGPEMTVYHEAFGHGLSVFTSRALQGLLTPDQLVERATYEMQVLNNRDWVPGDGSVPEIFAGSPRVKMEEYMATADKIDPSVYKGLIWEYPVRRLLEPDLYLRIAPDKTLEAVEGSIFDVAWSAGGENFLRPVKPAGLKPGYSSWQAFVADYMPMLADAAGKFNSRARILHTGLGEFKDKFDNDLILGGMVADRGDLSTEAWLRRMDIPVANAIAIHLFSRGELGGVDYRNRFSRDEQEAAEGMVYGKRMLSKGEVWAEGVAFSHFFGTRLQGDPFRRSLEHVASLIS